MGRRDFLTNESKNATKKALLHSFLAATGDRKCRTFYKRLANMLAEKRKQPVEVIFFWLARKLNFPLMRSVVMFVRGERCHRNLDEFQPTSDAHSCKKFVGFNA